MKHKPGHGSSTTRVQCLQQDVLRHLVKIAGLEDMTIWRSRTKVWHLSVKLKHRPQVYYLSTRRTPHVPRPFKRFDAALAAGQRVSSTRQFKLVLL
ncbi:MAG: hypothetical protein WBB60_09570 [Nitrospira sp.]|jgi:hypothetical protein|nr:hypothetical protein [Nitrospira sp.]HQY59225.1 hypothetical protein [Nitrospira sp.]